MSDNVNPSHYASHAVTPTDLVESYGLKDGFARGNVIKYVARAPEKNGHEDDMKALWYCLWLVGLRVPTVRRVIETVREELKKQAEEGIGANL